MQTGILIIAIDNEICSGISRTLTARPCRSSYVLHDESAHDNEGVGKRCPPSMPFQPSHVHSTFRTTEWHWHPSVPRRDKWRPSFRTCSLTLTQTRLVFRSSDNVHYKLHKLVLSLASDFFNDMFELPQPLHSSDLNVSMQPTGDPQVDGLLVIPVSEPSSVLTPLFLLCYPLELDPDLASIAQVRGVLEAAIKYDLRIAVKITRSRLRQLIPYAPLRVYAIACKLEFEDDARDAAEEVHKQQVQDKYVEELEEIPFGAYHRLLYYCALGGGSAPERQFTFSRAATTAPTGATGARRIKKKPQRGARVAPTPSSTKTPSTSAAGLLTATTPPASGSSNSQTCPDHSSPTETAAASDVQSVVFMASDGLQTRSAGNAILQASPALRDLSNKRSNPTEAIHVPKPAATLSILVRIYDPFEYVQITNLLDVHDALAAAVGYKLQKAITFLQDSLKSRQTVAPLVAH